LAEYGKMSKWDIHEKTKLAYPRVNEAITTLKKKGLVERVGEKQAKNKLPSPVYDLTFKGVLSYLSLQELKPPLIIGTHGESEDELRKLFSESNKEYVKGLKRILNFLKITGQSLDFRIFDQINWLFNNYGPPIISIILQQAKNQIAHPPTFLEALESRNKLEERQLTRTIEMMREVPSLQKIVAFEGKEGERVYHEIDVLKDEQNRLEQLRKEMEITLQGENEYLRKSFAYDFFDRLSYLPKKIEKGNASLAELAAELLKERRKTLSSLENIVEKLSLP
jgi:sugar-specific transcriptional regulator TrmB